MHDRRIGRRRLPGPADERRTPPAGKSRLLTFIATGARLSANIPCGFERRARGLFGGPCFFGGNRCALSSMSTGSISITGRSRNLPGNGWTCSPCSRRCCSPITIFWRSSTSRQGCRARPAIRRNPRGRTCISAPCGIIGSGWKSTSGTSATRSGRYLRSCLGASAWRR